jgi:hypothetical protein
LYRSRSKFEEIVGYVNTDPVIFMVDKRIRPRATPQSGSVMFSVGFAVIGVGH